MANKYNNFSHTSYQNGQNNIKWEKISIVSKSMTKWEPSYTIVNWYQLPRQQQ